MQHEPDNQVLELAPLIGAELPPAPPIVVNPQIPQGFLGCWEGSASGFDYVSTPNTIGGPGRIVFCYRPTRIDVPEVEIHFGAADWIKNVAMHLGLGRQDHRGPIPPQPAHRLQRRLPQPLEVRPPAGPPAPGCSANHRPPGRALAVPSPDRGLHPLKSGPASAGRPSTSGIRHRTKSSNSSSNRIRRRCRRSAANRNRIAPHGCGRLAAYLAIR